MEQRKLRISEDGRAYYEVMKPILESGNPLQQEEVLRHCIENGWLTRNDARAYVQVNQGGTQNGTA